jgi:hypothetical protein
LSVLFAAESLQQVEKREPRNVRVILDRFDMARSSELSVAKRKRSPGHYVTVRGESV